MKIVFTGGGTGGHIYPILTVVEELEKRNIPSLECIYIGPDSLSRDTLGGIRLTVKTIASGKLRRYISFKTVFDIFKVFLGIVQSYWTLLWVMPDVIFGKGGHGSFPIVLMGWLFRVPIIIHESDAVPGLANRILGRFAKKICYSFEFEEDYFPYEKLVYTGHPVRELMWQGTRKEAEGRFQLSGSKRVILVMGGSQGAYVINGVVLDMLGALLERYEIIHISGPLHFEGVARESRIALRRRNLSGYRLYPFLNQRELSLAYAAAHLVVSRAGAGSIFEIAAAGKPSILVPLAHSASDHQRKNASIYLKGGGARVIEEENLAPHTFLSIIEDILENEKTMQEMGENAKRFARLDAAKLVADEILKLVKPKLKMENEKA